MMMRSIILYPLLIWKITLVMSSELDSGLRIVPSSVISEWNPSSHFQSSRKLQEYPRPYALWNSEEIHSKLLEWKAMYPSLIHLTTAQESYGLPRSGGPNDCPFDTGGDGCLNYILTLQDFIAHPDGSASSSRLPEVFWSGCVHGNERVGPTAVMEATSLLLEAASCEAKPLEPSYNHEILEEKDIELAKSCRSALLMKGITDNHRRWLARLVTTRRIVILPTANVLGYFQNTREENGIDPNRDFPIDIKDKTQCMQTIAGRTINEVFRDHMFQLALTFHGGMEVIGYEWGAPTFLHKWSPDDHAQSDIAHAYSRFGAGWKESRPYDVGTMNDKVYYVRGGMEDWAYCGSWIPEVVIQCEPTTYNSYPIEKTTYNNATLRVFNMLVETSDEKIPRSSMLGTSKDILSKDTIGNGHVSRNIRLSLLSADLVEPYVSLVSVHETVLPQDIVPMASRDCKGSLKRIMIPRNIDNVAIEWTVGGALNIDETLLWKTQNYPIGILDCISQPSRSTIESYFQEINPDGPNSGAGYFASHGPLPLSRNASPGIDPPMGPLFHGVIDVSSLKPGEKVTILVSARVDQSWANAPSSNVKPNIQPQSHVVNARTNSNWSFQNAGKIVEGRLDWFSIPIEIVIGDYDDNTGENKDGRAAASPFDSQMIRDSSVGYEVTFLVIGILSCSILVLLILACMRRDLSDEEHRIIADDELEHGVSKPFSDEGELGMVELRVI